MLHVASGMESHTDIDEAMIDRLVRAFYGEIRADPLLGPIFARHIADWEPHLQAMTAFWSSVMLQRGGYQGQPMRKHLPLPIDAQHFDRWLALFETTARHLCSPDIADRFIDRAQRIAESLQLGLATSRGVVPGPPARK